VGTEVLSLGHEADHSPPSNAEVKKGGVLPPLSHTSSSWCGYQQIKHRDDFTVYEIIGIF
jgi:hypothetical protein